MKIFLSLMILSLPVMAAENLDEWRWKKRILVLTEKSPAVEAALNLDRKGLEERDVIVLSLKGEPAPAPALAAQLSKRLAVKPEKAEVLLLGKDGRTTVRWKAEEFDLAKLFREIDSMPMRQREMQGRE